MPKIPFGTDKNKKTILVGDPAEEIYKIFINGQNQFASNDYSALLNRFGAINNIKNSDYQEGIAEIFSHYETI